ncbi:hypothetical protein CMV30_16835 [Nibricoccus aquaticus]|uniref:HNH endonuclease 5 domain-containing protein n=1 Tax=Nibricoccus aquaticus TaxID=2576891 RepID=A0A290QGS8_9BACT|nr:hypothetical protein [Nibricoccus aquaticus]ATC65476.1 hypothetical protein CMV30_16835 [Nibricoccus aquaticus]
MDQLKDFADNRLINGCIHCAGPADTRDHIPSRSLLDQPFPENLPVIGCCQTCNQSFSKDEEYLVCLVDAVLSGSAEPDKISRPSVARILRNSPALRARIESAKRQSTNTVEFAVEQDRVANVLLKLARGHAAYELSQPCREPPDHFWCGPLATLPSDVRDAFNAFHEQKMFGEVGSRGLQRLLVTEMVLNSGDGKESRVRMLINDWVEVQEGNYRYLAIDDAGGIVIRIVVREYLACEVCWRMDIVGNITDEKATRS